MVDVDGTDNKRPEGIMPSAHFRSIRVSQNNDRDFEMAGN